MSTSSLSGRCSSSSRVAPNSIDCPSRLHDLPGDLSLDAEPLGCDDALGHPLHDLQRRRIERRRLGGSGSLRRGVRRANRRVRSEGPEHNHPDRHAPAHPARTGQSIRPLSPFIRFSSVPQLEPDRQALDAADEARMRTIDASFELPAPHHQRREELLQLPAREVRAQTGVFADPEADVAIGSSIDPEFVQALEVPFVAVRGRIGEREMLRPQRMPSGRDRTTAGINRPRVRASRLPRTAPSPSPRSARSPAAGTTESFAGSRSSRVAPLDDEERLPLLETFRVQLCRRSWRAPAQDGSTKRAS